MKTHLNILHKPAWKLSLIVILLLIVGCAQNNHGRFKMDEQVSQAFINGSVQPDLNYYYSGRETMPYAIIGVDSRYSVPSKYWIQFDPEPDKLKKMSGNVYGQLNFTVSGAHMISPDGQVIGVWYSAIRNRSVSVDPVDRSVQVLFRNPESLSQVR